MKKKFLLIAISFLLYFSGISQTPIDIIYANDSLMFNDCPSGTPPVSTGFTVMFDDSLYILPDTIMLTVYFGDGAYQTVYTKFAITVVSHTYLTLGIFDVTYIASDMYGNTDTVFHPAEVFVTNNCSSLLSYVFVDNNSNCIYDAGDSLINNVPLTLYNGISHYGIFPSGSVYLDIPDTINYTAVINVNAIQQLGYNMTCPASGFINFTASGSDILYFAVNCNSNYDLSITSSGNPFKVANSSLISVGVSDLSCIPMSGTYTLIMDSLLSFVYALHPPSTGSGQIYSWDFSNLATVGSGQGSISNMMYFNLAPSVQIGDTVCYSFSVSPTLGDINTTNNIVNLCYPVLNAWDPNYKDVYPKGNGIEGYIPANTKLTYTIGFQNTGNDTANHVYVLDTLDYDLDINSLQIIYTSHSMHFYIINGNILKFDFNNIQLPDSGTNQMLSHGFIVYEINQKSNLPPLTQIINEVGIYFDSNPAVITNQTLNTVEQTLFVSENIKTVDSFSIYPNPTTGRITIEAEGVIGIEVMDITGKIIIKHSRENGNPEKWIPDQAGHDINLGSQPKGIYFIKVTTQKGVVVEKVVLE